MATKGSGTARPFVRISPVDLTLYQALIDALAPAIEGTLAPRDRVFAYRQSLDEASDDAFAGSPRWDDFMSSVRSVLEANSHSHVLTADIASFFVYVDYHVLERRLLAAGGSPAVVTDLGNLLRSWHMLGVHGLPQGIPPSSPLGNFFLSSLDGALSSAGYDFRRYMDDFWVFADSFGGARAIQDLVEKRLYEDRLSLGGEKSKILRRETALAETETAKEAIEKRKQDLRDEAAAFAEDPYVEGEPELDPEELDAAAVASEYHDVVPTILRGTYPPRARARLVALYRELEALRDPGPISDVPAVLVPLPDVTGPAMRYVANSASSDLEAAVDAFLSVLDLGRFHREQELLHVFRAALWLPNRSSEQLAEVCGYYALNYPSALVRARALLAWGAQSPAPDFSAADAAWGESEAAWRPYVLVSIQDKDEKLRDERFDRWSGEGRFLRTLADAVKEQPFRWRTL